MKLFTFLIVFFFLAIVFGWAQPANTVFPRVSLTEQGLTPAAADNRVTLYGKDVGGVTKAFARFSDGSEVDLSDTGTGNFSETSLSGLVNNQVFWNSGNASRTLTFGLSGASDPLIRFDNDTISIISTLNVSGAARFTNNLVVESTGVMVANGGPVMGTYNTSQFGTNGFLLWIKNGVILTNPVVQSHSGSPASLIWKATNTTVFSIDGNIDGRVDFAIPASGGVNARVFLGGRWQFEKGTTNLVSTYMQEIAAPGTPAANFIVLYAKDDGGVSKLFYKGDNGTEVGPLGAGGAGAVSGNIFIDSATATNGMTNLGPYIATGTNDGRIRMAGTNLGFFEWMAPTTGESNSFVAHVVKPLAGQMFQYKSVTPQASTNRVILTNLMNPEWVSSALTAVSQQTNFVADFEYPIWEWNSNTNINIIHATNGPFGIPAAPINKFTLLNIYASGVDVKVTVPATWALLNFTNFFTVTNGATARLALQTSGADQTNVTAAIKSSK